METCCSTQVGAEAYLYLRLQLCYNLPERDNILYTEAFFVLHESKTLKQVLILMTSITIMANNSCGIKFGVIKGNLSLKISELKSKRITTKMYLSENPHFRK